MSVCESFQQFYIKTIHIPSFILLLDAANYKMILAIVYLVHIDIPGDYFILLHLIQQV